MRFAAAAAWLLLSAGCGSTGKRPQGTGTTAPTATPAVPTGTPAPAAAYVYVAAGDNGGAAVADAYVGYVDAGGDVYAWVASSPVPAGGEASLPGAADDGAGTLFLAGGFADFGFDGRTSAVSVGAYAGGAFTAWAQASPLPVSIGGSAAATDGNFLYVLGGGAATGESREAWRCAVAGQSMLSGWTTASAALPLGVWGAAAFASGGSLYVLGGRASGVSRTTAFSGVIRADGDVRSWNTTTSLPVPWSGGCCLVDAGHVVLLGGRPAGSAAWTGSAQILPGGQLSAWTAQPPLPAPGASYAGAALAAVGGSTHVYLIGGWDGGTSARSAVYRTTLTAGSLSAWQSTLPFPVPINDQAAATNR